jgi:NAD(P)-dependent dehydrogenase (short-subunit alcohol dehydrogenase family)
MALGLAEAGADIVVASRKLDNCQAVAAQIETMGRRALAVAAHTGNYEDLDNLVEQSYLHFGRVDIVINNAGINPAAGAIADVSPQAFQKTLEVNTLGPWYLSAKLAPRMAEHGGGVIINVISVSGLRGAMGQGAYGASKAALQSLTQTMAIEWAPMKVRVNAIAPGSYHSDLMDGAIAAFPEFEEGAKAASLQKRIAATDEIVGPVLYLASDASAYSTGSTLLTDGGYMLA